jgi:hypothetical protein
VPTEQLLKMESRESFESKDNTPARFAYKKNKII